MEHSSDPFEEVRRELEDVIDVQEGSDQPRSGASVKKRGKKKKLQSLLWRESIQMTAFAEDPTVPGADGKPLITQLMVAADRLLPGPRSHRLHVVDVSVGSYRAEQPAKLSSGDGWTYVDHWAKASPADLVADKAFHSQNVFAVASHTLALFEKYLGRRLPWRADAPQLFLVPHAIIDANAYYSPEQRAILFGQLPAVAGVPALYTCLARDIIAHEMSHAVLDGLRPRFAEPGLPDQAAFHEGLADVVAILSVLDDARVVTNLLKVKDGKIANRFADSEQLAHAPLLGLAEQLGRRIDPHRGDALRRSVELPRTDAWRRDPTYEDPHRLGEVFVAAVLQTFVAIWSRRIAIFKRPGGMDADRVAEEGAKAAEHLLGMVLRALDYLPPVELEYGDVIDAIITADKRLAPEDPHHYRDALIESFKAFGIVAPKHRILDLEQTPYKPRYEHLNFNTMRTSPEEIYQFIWNNPQVTSINLDLFTQVERVVASTRVGPDGLVVNEVLADYVQMINTTADALPKGMRSYRLPPKTPVQLWGGGVLVFDQFGRFRLHQTKDILDVDRQNRRLRYLVAHRLSDTRNGYGASIATPIGQRFAALHKPTSPEAW